MFLNFFKIISPLLDTTLEFLFILEHKFLFDMYLYSIALKKSSIFLILLFSNLFISSVLILTKYIIFDNNSLSSALGLNCVINSSFVSKLKFV